MKKAILTYCLFSIALTLFAQQRGFKPVNITIDNKVTTLYRQSHALVIGNSVYTTGWPNLPGVKQDVFAVKDALEQQGFNVVLKENLTKEQMDQAFTEFIKLYGQNFDNRLLFYFAGHGHTIKTNYGEKLGYIVPTDAPNPNVDAATFQSKAMEMAQIEIYAKRIQSKHAIFNFDACFSGALFATTRAIPEAISYKTANAVRQFITSGDENETVPDKSVFRQQFVTALTTDYADANKDGYITGTELGEFLQNNVVNYTYNGQHPQYGKIRNAALDKGDFVFVVNTTKTLADNNQNQINANNKQTIEPTLGNVEELTTYGNLQLTTEIAGDLYLDGKKLGTIKANTKVPVNKIATGSHSLEIRGTENFSQQLTIYKDQTSQVNAKTQVVINNQNNNTYNTTGEMEVMGIKLMGITGGSFQMGSNEGENEKPIHTVRVGNFKMGKHEVTVSQFKQFIDESGYQTDADKRTGGYGSYCWNGTKWEQKDGVNWKCGVGGEMRPQSEYNHPVIHVSWNDAVAYAEWLSKKSGQTWRLPTEAEWEYAARGGQNYKYAGSENIDDIAWYSSNSGNTTHEVGQKTQNGFGLYDMTGNVWEWCSDWYDNAYYSSSPQDNPQGASTGSNRVLRGGSWFSRATLCRSAIRNSAAPDNRDYSLCFRLVLVP